MHITGERFNSSMSTTLMRSVLKLQEGIYKQYSLFTYGDIRKLSLEERAMLELYVKVEEGSSWIELIPAPIINSVSENIGKMTPNQVLIGIAIVSIASTICVITKKVIDHKEKIESLKKQSKSFWITIENDSVQKQQKKPRKKGS